MNSRRVFIGVVLVLALALGLGWYLGLLDRFLGTSQDVVVATTVEKGKPAAPAADAKPAATAESKPATAKPTVVIPQFDVVRVEPTGDAVMAGSSAPGAKVEVLSGAEVIATNKATDGGQWALSLEKPLAPGGHDISLRATAPGSDVAVMSDQHVAISVPEGGKGDVLVVINQPGAPSRLIQVPGTTPDSAAYAKGTSKPADSPVPGQQVVAPVPPTAQAQSQSQPQSQAQTQVPAPAAPVAAVHIASVELEGEKLFITGTAGPAGALLAYLDDLKVMEGAAAADGSFSLSSRLDVPAGSHKVRVDQVDKDGKVLARAEVPFERMADPQMQVSGSAAGSSGLAGSGSASSEILKVTIKKGDNLWNIARKLYGNGFHYATIYQANTDQIRNPSLIYPGQVFLLPKEAAEKLGLTGKPVR